MRILLTLTIYLVSMSGYAQFWFADGAPPDYRKHPDTLYFPFYNGIQMIEIDYLSGYDQMIFMLEQSQPRAMPHTYDHPFPGPNPLIFRDTTGRVVKAFNSSETLEDLTKHFDKIPIDQVSTTMVFQLSDADRIKLEKHASNLPDVPPNTRNIGAQGTVQLGARLFHKNQRQRHKGMWVYSSTSMCYFNGLYEVRERRVEPSRYRFGQALDSLPENKAGAIDTFGNVVIPLVYTELFPMGKYILVQKDDLWGLLDNRGDVVLPIDHTIEEWHSDQSITFRRNGKMVMFYLIREDRFIKLNNYDWAENLRYLRENGITRYARDGKIGFLDSNYKELTPPIYDFTDRFDGTPESLARACRGGKWGYVNKQGKEVIPFKYDHAWWFYRDGMAQVMEGVDFHCINKQGEAEDSCMSLPTLVRKPYGVTKCARQYGILDSTGRVVIPIIYDQVIRMREEPVYWVIKEKKWGIVDSALNLVLPCTYDHIDYLNSHFFRVKVGERYGVIDRNYELVLECKYDFINDYKEEKGFSVVVKDKRFWVNLDGEVRE